MNIFEGKEVTSSDYGVEFFTFFSVEKEGFYQSFLCPYLPVLSRVLCNIDAWDECTRVPSKLCFFQCNSTSRLCKQRKSVANVDYPAFAKNMHWRQ